MNGHEYVTKWNEEYKSYIKILAKYNVYLGEMANMQAAIDRGEFKLTIVNERYHRTPSGRWQSKPYETQTQEIDAEFYMNTITSIPLFKDRVVKTYTQYGYIPTELSCVSWGTADTKAKRTFKFESLS